MSFSGSTKDESVMKSLKDYHGSLLVITVKSSFHAVINFLVLAHNYFFYLLINCLGTPAGKYHAIIDLICIVRY